jgi:hypothetical protein
MMFFLCQGVMPLSKSRLLLRIVFVQLSLRNNLLCRWEDDIVGLVQKKHGNKKVLVSFECETLKADKAAEEHISRYMPNLCGLDAVGKHGAPNFPHNEQQSLDHEKTSNST